MNIEAGQEQKLRAAAAELANSRDPRLLGTVDLVFDAFIKMVSRGAQRIYGDILERMVVS